MFKKLSRKMKIKKDIRKYGVFIDIHTAKLKKDVEFVLHNLPKTMVNGIEIIEHIFEVANEPQQIIVKPTMNAMDIKRQIGIHVFRKKRWQQQEAIAKKLLAEEKIDLNMFYEVYETEDYLTVYEIINADIFAVSYGNDSMSITEIAHAVNSLYIKKFTEINFSKQHNLDSLVDELFEKNTKM